MNGLALFALAVGAVAILFIPFRGRPHGRRDRRRGPINITLHRTDRS